MNVVFARRCSKMVVTTEATPAGVGAPVIRGLTTDKEWLHE